MKQNVQRVIDYPDTAQGSQTEASSGRADNDAQLKKNARYEETARARLYFTGVILAWVLIALVLELVV